MSNGGDVLGDGRRAIEVEQDRTRALTTGHRDLLIAALARYVEALHRRYPDGPEELRRKGLDARAKVSRMRTPKKDSAA